MVHSSSANFSWLFRKSPLFDNNLITSGKKVTAKRQRRYTNSEYYNFEISVPPFVFEEKNRNKI